GFTGTIVFISHDRYFINRIATQVVEVARGRLTTHLGTYDDYLDSKAAAAATPATAPERPTASKRSTSPERSTASERNSADQTGVRDSRKSAAGGSAGAISGPPDAKSSKNETSDGKKTNRAIDREIRAIKVRLSAVETQIQELEARQQEIGLALADPDLYRDGQKAREIAQSRRETEERVAWLMQEWEELSQRLSTVAGEER
ncbi:MAG TPA: hypothetical protein VK535_07575, partial [Gemmatimonadales bacterium]|nr:hypothetical protein [Gemmatimonadales bacterium]